MKKFYKQIIVGAFLLVPFFSSIISTIHVVDLFSLGNITPLAIVLAVVFEMGQLSSLMTLTILDKINKTIVWSIFILLALMQILGNVYYSFDFITNKLAQNPNWLGSALELINKFTYSKVDVSTGKFIISLVVGLPIPLISIAFLKSLVDYLKVEDKSSQADSDLSPVNIAKTKVEETPIEVKSEPVNKEEVAEYKTGPNDSLDDALDIIDDVTKKQRDKDYINSLWKNVKDNVTYKPPKEKEVDLGTIRSKAPFINNK